MTQPMEPCPHGKAAPVSVLTGLPDNQGGTARHKCPVCAYEEGLKAGIIEGIRRAQAAISGVSVQP